MNITLKPIHADDLPFICDVYNYYIKNSTATFHTEHVDIEEIKTIVPFKHHKYETFIIKNKEGENCGYAYLGYYKPRQAYDRTAEVTIYLKPEKGGKGYGKETLELIETIAKNKDIKVLLGVITAENIASVRVFEKCNYERCAHFKQVGEKFGKILDVVIYEKILETV